MPERFDVAVIGGGPAGCAAAITAALRGKRVALLEAGCYPRHKVCGEFISPESLELLRSLLGDSRDAALLERAVRIARSEIFIGRRRIELPITPAAASITRYDLDRALWSAAAACDVEARTGSGYCTVARAGNGFKVEGSDGNILAGRVIDCSGRRAGRGTGSFVGIKAHFRCDEALESVQLYFGLSGYCGVSAVGDGVVNACALVRASAVKENKKSLIRAALGVHPSLRAKRWEQISDTVVTAARFGEPHPIRDGVMCAGDAAGFIDPFLGDGISLALQSGTLAGSTDDPETYAAAYARRFVPVFRRAARLRRLLSAPVPLQGAAALLMGLPFVGRAVVAATRPSTGAVERVISSR